MIKIKKDAFDDWFVVFRQISEDDEFQITLEHHSAFVNDPNVDKAVAISKVDKLKGHPLI